MDFDTPPSVVDDLQTALVQLREAWPGELASTSVSLREAALPLKMTLNVGFDLTHNGEVLLCFVVFSFLFFVFFFEFLGVGCCSLLCGPACTDSKGGWGGVDVCVRVYTQQRQGGQLVFVVT